MILDIIGSDPVGNLYLAMSISQSVSLSLSLQEFLNSDLRTQYLSL